MELNTVPKASPDHNLLLFSVGPFSVRMAPDLIVRSNLQTLSSKGQWLYYTLE